MRQGCLTAGGVLLAIALIGFVYLTINPPLKQPDTGYLSRSTEVRARLDAGHPVAAFEVRFGAPAGVYERAGSSFPLLSVSAALIDESATGGHVQLSAYPRDSSPLANFETSDGGSQVSWRIECHPEGTSLGCARNALLVLDGTDLPSDGLDARVRVFVEQRFPARVPTPFLVSLDLSTQRLEVGNGDRLMASRAHGSGRLSPTQPVMRWSLNVDAPRAPLSGSWLTMTTSHADMPIPTGFDAPPPVAVAVIDGSGEVVVSVGARPGTSSTVAVPPLAGDYQVVAWWQDRATQAYDLQWQVEQGAIGSGSPELTAQPEAQIQPAIRLDESGELTTDPSGRTQAIATERPPTSGSISGANHLPSHLAVVQVTLTPQTGGDGSPSIVLSLDGAPTAAVPGTSTRTALGKTVNCAGYRCSAAVEVSTAYQVPATRMSWQAVVTLWPLDPAAGSLQ